MSGSGTFIRKLPVTIALGSFALGVIIWLVMKPWTPDLGPSFSPARIALIYVVSVLMLFIPGIMCTYMFSQNQKWLAPPGKYVAGVKYKPFSPYMLTAAAIAAAIYAVGGLPTGVNIDLPALITSFSAVYFGSVVCLLAFSLGFFVRWAIGGAPWLRIPALIPVIAFIDSGIWAINAFIFWRLMRAEGIKSSPIRFIISIVLMILIHLFGWLFVYAFTVNPLPAAVAYVTFAFSTWYPTAIVFIIIGALIGEPMYRSRFVTK